MLRSSRREWMQGAAGVALVGMATRAMGAAPSILPDKASIAALAVRLRPSVYATAVETNRRYLYRLSPDRLLHNFRAYAGLEPKAAIYGGWESDTIAGHTLGHYMSALVLTWQQTTAIPRCDAAPTISSPNWRRLRPSAAPAMSARWGASGPTARWSMARNLSRNHGGQDQVGRVRPERFLVAALHGAQAVRRTARRAWRLGQCSQALDVAVKLGGYFARVFAALDDAQMQTVLGCEYGGLNESYAELYQRTGDRQWLALAERIYDRKCSILWSRVRTSWRISTPIRSSQADRAGTYP